MAKIGATPQRGAFSRVLNRLACNAKIVFSPQRGAFSRVLNRLVCNAKIVFSPQRGAFSWVRRRLASRARELIRTRSAVKRVLDCAIPIATHHCFVLGLVARRSVFHVNLFCNRPS